MVAGTAGTLEEELMLDEVETAEEEPRLLLVAEGDTTEEEEA